MFVSTTVQSLRVARPDSIFFSWAKPITSRLICSHVLAFTRLIFLCSVDFAGVDIDIGSRQNARTLFESASSNDRPS
jgi:hypothetical protein